MRRCLSYRVDFNNFYKMRIFILIVSLFFIWFWDIYAAANISHKEMARDLNSILLTRTTIDATNTKVPKYIVISRKYLRELDAFWKKYITPLWVFTLRPELDRTLSYPLHIQQYSLSCEIAALRIILGWLGLSVSENEIFVNIPIFRFPYTEWGIWWDPDKEFVWMYTGSQSKKTGYWIYENPLALYAKKQWFATEIINQYSYTAWFNQHKHLVSLLQKIKDKNVHVLLWWDWCTSPSFEDGILKSGGKWIIPFFPLPARNTCKAKESERIMNWTTPEGKQISGLAWEHAFVLLGYIGKVSNPSHIIVWDTYTWRHIYSYGEWMRKWSLMQNRSLIISRN